MSESEAIVTQLDGDHVWLDVNGNSNCSSCESSQGCGDNLIAPASCDNDHSGGNSKH